MSAITLRQLEIFAQAVEFGSFRKCAERIGVSPVAISDHIRALEAGLGQQLFLRQSGGPARLTVEGEAAYQRTVTILNEVNQLLWQFSDVRKVGKRKIRIGGHPFILRNTQKVFEDFAREHPSVHIDLDLDSLAPETIQQRIQERTLDIGYHFAFAQTANQDPGVLCHEPLAVYVGYEHPLARQTIINIEELQRTPAIHLSPRNYLRALIDLALSKVGLVDGLLALQSDDYGMILSTARRNQGFICMFAAAQHDVVADGLVCLTLEKPLPPLLVRQVLPTSWRNDALLSELIERVSEAIRQGDSGD